MPGFDGTGPAGRGPMTGGGRGYCAVNAGGRGAATGGFAARGCGRRAGRGTCFYGAGHPGRMRGRGWTGGPGGFAGSAYPVERPE